MATAKFDAAYFDRFYESPATRVSGKKEIAHLARATVEMIRWFGGDLHRVLDVGAGPGFWRDWFRRHLPSVEYLSTDVSPYACDQYGHQCRDISRWVGRGKFDLIVCQGVLPYLGPRACEQAIANMARMARGFLYLEAVTARDLTSVCDRERTDLSVYERPGLWYRKRLAKYFQPLGCGLHYVRGGPLQFFELEAPSEEMAPRRSRRSSNPVGP